MRTSATILLTLGLVLAGCTKEPSKPKTVPAEAFWVGPKKTGVFLQVGKPVGIGWEMTLFDPRTGAVKGKGVYLLQGFGRAEIRKQDVASWDGHEFLLTDGGKLVPRP